MNNPELIITIVTIVLTIISSILGFFLSRNEKTKKHYETYLKIENKVKELMIVAEKHYQKGDQKKKYVISNVNTYLKDNKINFDLKLVDIMIESIVNITKHIN